MPQSCKLRSIVEYEQIHNLYIFGICAKSTVVNMWWPLDCPFKDFFKVIITHQNSLILIVCCNPHIPGRILSMKNIYTLPTSTPIRLQSKHSERLKLG